MPFLVSQKEHLPMSLLTPTQLASFRTDGYLIFPRFFEAEECAALKADIDALQMPVSDGTPRRRPCEMPHLGQLISHPKVMDIVTEIMGAGFAFHHLHAVRQDVGTSGVPWHQDYEQYPQSNRSHVMAHFFYYLNGLNGTIGDLLFLPQSQKTIVSNEGLSLLGTADLPGTVVVNDLPPGSAVLVHSALWHARRAQPGGEGQPRYFVDASYCQAGVQWPSYGGANWREVLAKARTYGMDQDGRYAHLFDESHFFDERAAHSIVRASQGSLVLETIAWKETHL
jgi:hypothetical protein